MTTAIAPNETESDLDDKLDEQAETNEPEEKEPPTIAELEHAHLEAIKEQNHKVRDAAFEWEQAKLAASSKKKRYESLSEQLQDLIAEDPRQHKLPFAEGDSPEIKQQAYREVATSELGLADGLTAKLEENDLGTLGKLQDFWDGRGDLKDLSGIGEEKAASVIDAFADYGSKHPEMFTEGEDENQEPPEADQPAGNEASG